MVGREVGAADAKEGQLLFVVAPEESLEPAQHAQWPGVDREGTASERGPCACPLHLLVARCDKTYGSGIET